MLDSRIMYPFSFNTPTEHAWPTVHVRRISSLALWLQPTAKTLGCRFVLELILWWTFQMFNLSNCILYIEKRSYKKFCYFSYKCYCFFIKHQWLLYLQKIFYVMCLIHSITQISLYFCVWAGHENVNNIYWCSVCYWNGWFSCALWIISYGFWRRTTIIQVDPVNLNHRAAWPRSKCRITIPLGLLSTVLKKCMSNILLFWKRWS